MPDNREQPQWLRCTPQDRKGTHFEKSATLLLVAEFFGEGVKEVQ
jgi:hypothetical protein